VGRGFDIGIGVSRAFSIQPKAETYANLIMGMIGVISAVAIPTVYYLFKQ
jgi:putative effector of murein hydrolase